MIKNDFVNEWLIIKVIIKVINHYEFSRAISFSAEASRGGPILVAEAKAVKRVESIYGIAFEEMKKEYSSKRGRNICVEDIKTPNICRI